MTKAISILLSLLMLASSSGISYAQHFCGGMEMMSEISLGEKHLSCGMVMDVTDTDCSDKNPIPDSHDCCKNHITKIQTDDNFAKASFELNLNKIFVAPFVSVFILQELEKISTQKTLFAEYNPPPLEQDLNILYEVFLI